MDLIAWSPAVCKELKRLCTRVPKKRTPRLKLLPQFQSQPAFMPQIPEVPTQTSPFPTIPYPTQQYPTQQAPQTDTNQAPFSQPTQSTYISLLNSASITAATMEAEKHTRLSSTLNNTDKASRIITVVRKVSGSEIILEKPQT